MYRMFGVPLASLDAVNGKDVYIRTGARKGRNWRHKLCIFSENPACTFVCLQRIFVDADVWQQNSESSYEDTEDRTGPLAGAGFEITPFKDQVLSEEREELHPKHGCDCY
jgi:hypothetical protein